MKKLLRLVLSAVLGTGALLGASGSGVAHATAKGPCTGTLNGIDVATRSATDPDDAIEVEQNDSAIILVNSSQPIGHYKVQLSFSGFSWDVAQADANGTSWTRTVKVGDYSKFGVGLYQVHVTSGGAAPCEGIVLVRVLGSPFGTLAGWIALALAALGIGAVAMALLADGFPKGKIGLGALGGLGVVGLSQEFALAYPTPLFSLLTIGAGAALPLLAHGAHALLPGKTAASHVGPQQLGSPDPSQQYAQHSYQLGSEQAGSPQAGFQPPGAQQAGFQQPGPQQHGLGSGPDPSHAQGIHSQDASGMHGGHGTETSGTNVGHGQELGQQGGAGAQHVQSPLAPGFVPNHVVGNAGLPSWGGPGAGALASTPLDPGLPIRLLETVGDRVLVECSNGWRTWVAAAAVGRAVT